MSQHRESFRTDGVQQSIGPFRLHGYPRGVLLLNRTSVDAVFYDDSGNQYDAPAHVAASYPLAVPTTRLRGGTVVATPAADRGSLIATVTDSETILSTAQLLTINLSTTVIRRMSLTDFAAYVPADQDVVELVIPADSNAYTLQEAHWLVRYDATWTTDAYRWKVIGGSPLTSNIETDEPLAVGGVVWGDVATVGPQIVVPRGGLYAVDGGCTSYYVAAANNVFYYGFWKMTGAGSPALIESAQMSQPVANSKETVAYPTREYFLTEIGVQWRFRYASNNANAQFLQRRMRMMPRRIA